MLNKQALAALAACITLVPTVFADMAHKPPMAFCKEGTCDDKDNGCPAQITTSGDGFPACKVYDVETVLNVGEFESADGGGTSVFMDIFEPDDGCSVIVKSPASTDEEGCGFIVGNFKNAVCAKINLRKTFMIQHCCGSKDCQAATGSAKMIRSIESRRSLGARAVEIKGKDGKIIEPVQTGYAPQKKRSIAVDTAPKTLVRRKDDSSCKKYVPDGEVYTRPADRPQLVSSGGDGGNEGMEISISHERSVSQSVTFSAGINIEIISASTEMTFEETITDTKEKKWTVPAGQTGKVAFTPTLKCTSGTLECGDGTSKGEACTGFREADEIAGTYAVIATS
ncbi:MAG: hypothetical protein Q9223_007442 [Gallowayella weberi]